MSGNEVLYEQSDFPVFQNRMYATAEEARSCPLGDLHLVQDAETGLVRNEAFRPELVTYDDSYQNEQAHSPSFKAHLSEVAKIIESNLGTSNLVEVGCGKAYFLELLQSRGCSITGFDPTYEGENASVQKHFFEKGVGVSADGLILRHVLEHVQDPVSFLDGLRIANAGGLIYIEVPCFDWILNNRAWFDIFYEHVNYFRLGDFTRIFGNVVAGGHLFGGQYLYVVADLASLRAPAFGDYDRIAMPPDFLPIAAEAVRRSGQPTVVWGAASKGVIYSLLRARSGVPVDVLIDINPAKAGKFVPATGLRVVSPEEGTASLADGTDICVMNPNYVEEIRKMTRGRFHLVEAGR